LTAASFIIDVRVLFERAEIDGICFGHIHFLKNCVVITNICPFSLVENQAVFMYWDTHSEYSVYRCAQSTWHKQKIVYGFTCLEVGIRRCKWSEMLNQPIVGFFFHF